MEGAAAVAAAAAAAVAATEVAADTLSSPRLCLSAVAAAVRCAADGWMIADGGGDDLLMV